MENKPLIQETEEKQETEILDEKTEVNVDAETAISDNQNKDIKGLGGWLILVCIGMFGSLLVTVYNLSIFVPVFRYSTWHKLSESQFYHPLLKPTLIFEFSANSIRIILLIVMLILFFMQKKIFPKLAIINYAYCIIVVIVDSALAASIPALASDGSSITDIFRNIIAAAIWIPYFLTSVRVKNTFIK